MIYHFSQHKQQGRAAVLLIAPETGRLPDQMGPLARFISGKSGGLGEVITALCEGLTQQGVECHLAIPHLNRRFRKDNGFDEEQWNRILHTVDPEHIHLVNSSVFSDLPDVYAGNVVLNAAEFQKTIVNQIIPRICARNCGRLIIHSHDWLAGGIITAYARRHGLPVLHTVHNVHTGQIPLEYLFGVDTQKLAPDLYFSESSGACCIDSQATAIKNASLVNFVGERFLEEIVADYFTDRPVVPPSVRQEIKIKHACGAACAILNAPAPNMYPERCDSLVRKYGPADDIIAAKRENRMEFQRRTGLTVNPDAILLYWPSRLDAGQKGIELLEAIAQRFVNEHRDTQIAIVGNGAGNDRTHEEICGRIACASGGRITYQRFNEALSMLGFAAASDVFGASLYEPCGQIDQVGNLFGATATNRATGGYHDKIRELSLKGAKGSGNGFLFRDYDPAGLWYGLERAVQFHRYAPGIRRRHLRRIMQESRERYDLGTMIEQYIDVYEGLSGGAPVRPLERERASAAAGAARPAVAKKASFQQVVKRARPGRVRWLTPVPNTV
jgi:glycogen synthase